jgi:hypothetical protein
MASPMRLDSPARATESSIQSRLLLEATAMGRLICSSASRTPRIGAASR